ncbi:MAG: DUF4129 domain-containing protein [Clostridia bacterium]|nr:DUF4129 domain-containing protein [Clostridia bacterium]
MVTSLLTALLYSTGIFPLSVVLVLLYCETALPFSAMLAVLFPLFRTFCIRRKHRFPAALVVSALLFALFCFLYPVKDAPALLLIPAAYSLLLFLLMAPISFHLPTFAAFLLLHFGIYLFLISDLMESPLKAPARLLLALALFLCVLSALLLNNASILKDEIGFDRRVPRSIRHINVIYVVLLLVCSFVLVNIPGLTTMITRLFSLLMSLLGRLSAFIAGFFASEESSAAEFFPESYPYGMPGGEITFHPVLNAIVTVFSIVFYAASLLVLLLSLVRLLMRLIRRISLGIQRYMGSLHEEYTDTYEDLPDSAPPGRAIRRRHTRTFSPKTPSERIRHLYAQYLRRHPEHSPGQTARESIPEFPADLYGKARYSEHPLSGEDADHFRESLPL